MAEEPQPPTIHPGATVDPEDDAPLAPPKSAEDRKTAAALSSLDKRGDDEDDDGGSGGAKSQLDQEALGKAMSRLEVGAKKGGESAGTGKGAKEGEGEGDGAKRKVVKVDVADVGLLVSLSFGVGLWGCGGRGWIGGGGG